MRSLGTILLLTAFGLLLAVGMTVLAGLSLPVSLVLASIACILGYLMLDQKPEHDPGESTIVRLTRGSWGRKR